jgi:polysaccharide biosynthesis/export protein
MEIVCIQLFALLQIAFFLICASVSSVAQNATPSAGASVFPDATASASTKLQVSNMSGGDAAIRLGAGDLIEVSVYGVAELNTKTRVGNSGDIYLPLINYVHVGGLTIAEAEGVIEKRLDQGGFIKNPHVQLFVDEYTSQGVSVLGEVTRPGIYPALGEPRLLDVISAAGGFTDKAGKSITVTHRNRPDQPATVPLSRNMEQHPESNIPVYAGDTISVGRADVVYVVGDVVRPSGLLMNDGQVTVLQAIALAGGTTATAKLNSARIIRKGPSGLTEMPVQLKKLLEAKIQDIPLQPDDILFVPTSSRKMMAGRTVEAAMQLATSATLIAIRP